MDACLGYLQQLDVLMEGYVELPLYMDVFEAADPEVAEQSAKNAEIEGKSDSLLKKAIAAVKAIFKKCKEILNNIKEFLGMDEKERKDYEEFVKECQSNPEFKNLKVTIKDYREINKRYEEELKKAEAQYRSVKEEQADQIPKFVDTLGNSLKEVAAKAVQIGTAGGAEFAMEVAIRYARANEQNAYQVQQLLNIDIGLMDALEKQIGSKEVKRFKRRIKLMNHKLKFIRTIARGRQDQAMTLRDSIKEVTGAITSCMNRKEVREKIKAIDNKDEKKAAKLKYKEDKKTLKRLGKDALSNDITGGAIKKAAKTVGKEGVSIYRHEVRGSVSNEKKFKRDTYKRLQRDKAAMVTDAQAEAIKENQKRNASS